jgi:DNA-binding protein HU-beta
MTDSSVMHKRQLVDEVARRTGPTKGMQKGLTRQQVGQALDGILDVITDQMAEGNAVTIAGFGRFEAREHAARVVHLDGETYQVEPRLVPSFHPYDSLRAKVTGRSDDRLTPSRDGDPMWWLED